MQENPRTLQDFLGFRFMITPVFIQIIWLIGSVLIALATIITTLVTGDLVAILVGLFVGLPISLIIWRVYCELIILLFRIHDQVAALGGGRAPNSHNGAASAPNALGDAS